MRTSVQNFEQDISKLEDEKIKLLAKIENAKIGKEETVLYNEETP